MKTIVMKIIVIMKIIVMKTRIKIEKYYCIYKIIKYNNMSMLFEQKLLTKLYMKKNKSIKNKILKKENKKENKKDPLLNEDNHKLSISSQDTERASHYK